MYLRGSRLLYCGERRSVQLCVNKRLVAAKQSSNEASSISRRVPLSIKVISPVHLLNEHGIIRQPSIRLRVHHPGRAINQAIIMSQGDVYTSATFQPLLKRLVQTPECFTPDDLKSSLNHLFTPDVLQPTQIGAFFSALHIHRLERRPEFLAAAASLLRDKALKVTVQDAETDFVVDIVGTGGDGYNLFNVSTTAAVVAAGAGARVIKV